MSDPKKDDDAVLTPGGPRAAGAVHSVDEGDIVQAAESGDLEVLQGARVLTPGGYRDRRLVHRLLPNHALDASLGAARQFDLTTRAFVQTPQLSLNAAELPTFTSGWIAYAVWINMSGQPVTSFRTSWRVPKAPITDSGQTIFLFNGIDPIDPSRAILQPVLQWGPSAAGGGSYWSIASWYVANGVAFHTTLIPVAEDQELVGVMRLMKRNGARFNYASEFEGIPSTTLPVHNVEELVWFNQTLEAYSVTQCSDYPASSATAMYDISIQTGASSPTFSWEAVHNSTECGQNVSITPSGVVEIRYRL